MGLCGEKVWFEEKEQILEELRLRSGSLELTSWCARSFDSMEPQSSVLSFSTSSSDATRVLRGDHSEKKSGSAIERASLSPSFPLPNFWVQIVCDRLVRSFVAQQKESAKEQLSLSSCSPFLHLVTINTMINTMIKGNDQETVWAHVLFSFTLSRSTR